MKPPTVPRRVTTPSDAATAMVSGSLMRGSKRSSLPTSSISSLSVFISDSFVGFRTRVCASRGQRKRHPPRGEYAHWRCAIRRDDGGEYCQVGGRECHACDLRSG